MSKCLGCGAVWTTTGLSLCPICGVGVEQPAAVPVLEAAHKSNGASMPQRSVEAKKQEILPAAPDPASPRSETPVRDIPLRVTFFPRSESRSSAPPPETDAPVAAPPGLKALLASEPSGTSSAAGKAKSASQEWLDASGVFVAPLPPAKPLPTPARPLSGPAVLGVLSGLSVFMLPLTLAFQNHRVFGILGFCMTAFFLPFAPIAWIMGLGAEKRRREQGLRPERRVVFGRILGQCGTVLLIIEVAAALMLIAALRLSGRLPMTIWACEGAVF